MDAEFDQALHMLDRAQIAARDDLRVATDRNVAVRAAVKQLEALPRNATGKLPRANLMHLLQEMEMRETTGLG